MPDMRQNMASSEACETCGTTMIRADLVQRMVDEAVEGAFRDAAAGQSLAAEMWYREAETRRGRHNKELALARAAGHQAAHGAISALWANAAAIRKGER